MRGDKKPNSSSFIANTLNPKDKPSTSNITKGVLRFELQTHVRDGDQALPVIFTTRLSGDAEATDGKMYIGQLYLKTGELIGNMDFYVHKNHETVLTNFVYSQDNTQSDNKRLPYLDVEYMRNLTKIDENYEGPELAQVGNALQEAAFKLSVALGCEGRIMLSPSRIADYFHYKNGFRMADPHHSELYLAIASSILRDPSNQAFAVGLPTLYLPKESINKNIQKFCLSAESMKTETETEELRNINKTGEALIAGAMKSDPDVRMLVALSEKYCYGDRHDAPPVPDSINLDFYSRLSADENMNKFKKGNPSLFCDVTQNIIDVAFSQLGKMFPFDTNEKQTKKTNILVGMVVAAMHYQDSHYGNQERYGNKPLNAQVTDVTLEILSEIGADAIQNNKLPSEDALKAFFPKLHAIDEIKELVSIASLENKNKPSK